MVTAHSRGWLIKYVNNQWIYANNNVPVKNNERPCIKCGKMPTKEGYDTCLGYIPGATSACCGHGVEKGYVKYGEGENYE